MQCKIEPKCLPELHNWHPAERKRKWPCIVERWPFNREARLYDYKHLKLKRPPISIATRIKYSYKVSLDNFGSNFYCKVCKSCTEGCYLMFRREKIGQGKQKDLR